MSKQTKFKPWLQSNEVIKEFAKFGLKITLDNIYYWNATCAARDGKPIKTKRDPRCTRYSLWSRPDVVAAAKAIAATVTRDAPEASEFDTNSGHWVHSRILADRYRISETSLEGWHRNGCPFLGRKLGRRERLVGSSRHHALPLHKRHYFCEEDVKKIADARQLYRQSPSPGHLDLLTKEEAHAAFPKIRVYHIYKYARDLRSTLEWRYVNNRYVKRRLYHRDSLAALSQRLSVALPSEKNEDELTTKEAWKELRMRPWHLRRLRLRRKICGRKTTTLCAGGHIAETWVYDRSSLLPYSSLGGYPINHLGGAHPKDCPPLGKMLPTPLAAKFIGRSPRPSGLSDSWPRRPIADPQPILSQVHLQLRRKTGSVLR